MNYETVIVNKDPNGVATVTLNRPEVLNCFDSAMCREFSFLWKELREDKSVHAIVLDAAGDRAFSTGMDVTERLGADGNPWLDEDRPWDDLEDPGRDLGPKRNDVWKPVVAAVDGMCAGGAFYWIAECDIVVCTPRATFFDPHVTYGLVAALEPIAMSYRMHFSDAMRMALMGLHERMSAERALVCGLVTEVVPPEQLVPRTHEIAAVIASQPPAAIQGTVKAMWQSLDLTRAQALGTALMYTQVGNPIGTRDLDRAGTKPASWSLR